MAVSRQPSGKGGSFPERSAQPSLLGAVIHGGLWLGSVMDNSSYDEGEMVQAPPSGLPTPLIIVLMFTLPGSESQTGPQWEWAQQEGLHHPAEFWEVRVEGPRQGVF